MGGKFSESMAKAAECPALKHMRWRYLKHRPGQEGHMITPQNTRNGAAFI